MTIEVTVLEKYKTSYGTEVDISYTCPHCGESATDSICFYGNIPPCVASVCDQECPKCSKLNDLGVNLY